MIPEFPEFKKLELTDKKDIEKFTSEFPPYSDFNFFSMWGWDIKGHEMISTLNGNLVVLFNDYISGDKFLSFIGDKKIIETTSKLISFSEEKYKKNFLKLIPEEILLKYKGSNFVAKTDRNSFDYIYLVEHLAGMKDWKNNTCARGIKKFLKKHPNYVVKELSLKDISHDEYKKMFEKWSQNKKIDKHFELNEYKAFERFLEMNDGSIKFISVYMNDVLVGFSVYEILSKNYAMAHFSKADVKDYPEIYDLLNWEEAKYFNKIGVKYLNWEQDLGLSGLRYSKEKYKPCFLMRKFIISMV